MVQSECWQGLYVYDTVDSVQVQVGLLRDQDILLSHHLAMQRVYIKRTTSPAQLVVDCVEARKVQLSAYVCRLVCIGSEDWDTGNDGVFLFVSGLGQRDQYLHTFGGSPTSFRAVSFENGAASVRCLSESETHDNRLCAYTSYGHHTER